MQVTQAIVGPKMPQICNPWQAAIRQLLYLHAVGTVITMRVRVTLCNISIREVSVDMKIVWSIISAKIGTHVIQVITIGISGEGTIRKFLHVERLYKGCFLFGKWFKDKIAFCSEEAFRWMVSTAKR